MGIYPIQFITLVILPMLNTIKKYTITLFLSLCIPLSWLYSLIIQVRNLLYNYSIQKTYIFDRPIISVGNLTIGGTGKTPCIEYLIHLLKQQCSIIVLSRGYKRTTTGFILASKHDTACSIGDEPYQLYKKFANNAPVKIAVSEDRPKAINQLLSLFPGKQAILLDDAFQQRRIKPHLNILLTDFYRPFFRDHVLPAGKLREPKQEAKRADVIMVTKCPEKLSKATQQYFKHHINKYSGHKTIPIFFARINYQQPIPLFPVQQTGFSKNILLITGIANPQPLVNHIKAHYQLMQHLAFRDHHIFTPKDIAKISTVFHGLGAHNKCVLTSEKDSVRLMQPSLQALLKHIPIFYLPISMELIQEKQVFDRLMFDVIAYY